MRASSRQSLASVVVFVLATSITNSGALASDPSSHRAPPGSPDVVSIRATVNGLTVTVSADGTLAPTATTVGTTEQFELYDVGKGAVALRSIATGRFVSARHSEPLRADADFIGAAQRLRPVGAAHGLVRLRSHAARGLVCATQRGQGVLAITEVCQHRLQLFAFDAVIAPPPSFAITSPAPGSTLTSAVANFQWDLGGDEHWLKIGSVKGGSDIYESGSLGSDHQHTVSLLPLSGQTVYVQVTRRTGTLIETADAQYVAAIRKGLAVVTDFADRHLEDWTGPGLRSADDLRAQLEKMEQHWLWLSRDLERIQWDIVRVQLSGKAVAEGYSSWSAFREAAVALALQEIRPSDYDVNSDGLVDAVWLVVSSGEESLPYVIGGTSSTGGACVFVDGQSSGSVQAGATGNFNHELGHCLGLPDMYGTFSTLNKLTFMNDSWAQPPHDFSAYERVALGWADAQVIDTSTNGVWLPSANEQLATVLVPSNRPNEYFLIEYRNPPATGYGSATQGYRGLAVYHVLADSSMWQDPPIVKLEPADGINAPNEPLDPNDFLFPENPQLRRPFVVRSYYDGREPVFQIDNVVWRDGGIAFDVFVFPKNPPSPTQNLLLNGSFEAGQSALPEAWTRGWFVPQDASFAWPESSAAEGSTSALLASASGNDIRWSQSVATTPGERYQLCGFLKGEAVRGVQGDVGANVSLIGGFVRSQGLSGTFDWTKSCVDFTADAPRVEVACRLGFYGSTAAGKVWCDDFTLEQIRLHSAFDSVERYDYAP